MRTDLVKTTGVCAVSGCGEEIGCYRATSGKFPVLCDACRNYAVRKVMLQRGQKGFHPPIFMHEMLAALGVEFEARRGPVTGRAARFKHGRA